MTAGAIYDTIGRRYRDVRRPEPRIASAIWTALGDASSVVNVGAGTGSYEPDDRELIAVEPSAVMIAQRPAGAAPAIQAAAEALPLPDQAVDAAMAVLTLQHWEDVEQGLSEMLRVARRRIVLVTMDVEVLGELWVVRDYLPETLTAHAAGFPSIARLTELVPHSAAAVIPVPRECTDGFMAAFWGRPEAYLDPRVRAATSPWHQLPPAVVTRALDRLRRDLADGRWDRRHGHLRQQTELDVGLRLVCAEVSATRMARHTI
jgi:SAM-dependent methyltransferase